MSKIKQYRIASIAISIAVTLILSVLVTKLSDLNSRTAINDIKAISSTSTAIVAFDSDGNSYRLASDEFKKALNADSKTIYILNAETGRFGFSKQSGDFASYNVTTSELSKLNSLKVVLENQFAQLSEIENLSDEQQQEEIRILKQLSIVNDQIDFVTNTLEEPVSSDENTSFESPDRQATSKAVSENGNSDSVATSRAATESSTIADEPTVSPLLLQVIKLVLYFIATIVGIFFKAMWDSPNLKALFRFSNIKPVLIAPIVFYGVYATVNTLSDSLLAVLIAFQNGFFWQSILKEEQNKREVLVEQAKFVSGTAEAAENT